MSEHPDGNVVQLSAFRQKPDDANGLDQKGRGFEIAKAWAKDPSLYWRDFAQRLQIARKRLGISEPEAAAALRVTLRTYRKWERGQRHRENHLGVANFSQTLGVSIDWLVGGEEWGSPPRFRLRCV
jgi:ribosome-binding protein aMBF1 (putative translation factor)